MFISYDQYVAEKNKFDIFCRLSKKACYTVLKSILNSWEITLKSQVQLDGQMRIPKNHAIQEKYRLKFETSREGQISDNVLQKQPVKSCFRSP